MLEVFLCKDVAAGQQHLYQNQSTSKPAHHHNRNRNHHPIYQHSPCWVWWLYSRPATRLKSPFFLTAQLLCTKRKTLSCRVSNITSWQFSLSLCIQNIPLWSTRYVSPMQWNNNHHPQIGQEHDHLHSLIPSPSLPFQPLSLAHIPQRIVVSQLHLLAKRNPTQEIIILKQ